MKKQTIILAVSLLLISVVSAFAGEPAKKSDAVVDQEAITNYLAGLNSDNDGIRFSCAYFVGEYNISEAVIPLMKMLHNEKTEGGRIIAALSLIKMDSDKAAYAVKQAAQFDGSERVRKLCDIFYKTLSNENYNASVK